MVDRLRRLTRAPSLALHRHRAARTSGCRAERGTVTVTAEDLASRWIARVITAPGRLWTASAVLAGLRVASNDDLRAADRNRGFEKNRLNDIQGCFGELVALRVAEHL